MADETTPPAPRATRRLVGDGAWLQPATVGAILAGALGLGGTAGGAGAAGRDGEDGYAVVIQVAP